MTIRIFIISVFLIPFWVLAQQWDTSLVILYSRPYYYNVVKAGDGEIYAGTSDGICRLEETTPVKTDDRKGYLKIDKDGKVIIDPNGIKFHNQTRLNHLLPYPTEKRDEYHANKGIYLYVTSGGKMHIFDVKPYSFKFRNHSIRTISENFVGTYSGIYFKNKQLPSPISTFSDGYIREMNGKVFMCTYGLEVFSIKDIEDGPPYKRMALGPSFNFDKCSDIRFLKRINAYILSASNRVVLIDSGLQTVSTIFNGASDFTTTLLNDFKNAAFYFSAGNQLYWFDLLTKKVHNRLVIDEAILDGIVQSHSTFILGANHLYRQKGDEKPEKLVKLNRAHTLLPVSETEFIISTDEGLFLYRADENKLFTLIPGVEFNRRGLHIKQNKIYAGSVNGLYILDLSQMDQLIANANKTLNIINGNGLSTLSIALIASAFIILWVIVLIYRGRIKRMQTSMATEKEKDQKPKLGREEIEDFVMNNLPIASLKAINTHFATNTSMVYSILAPEKPGDLIQKLRYEKVKELRKEGKKAKDIATQTGLSDSYVRKIWNNLN